MKQYLASDITDSVNANRVEDSQASRDDEVEVVEDYEDQMEEYPKEEDPTE